KKSKPVFGTFDQFFDYEKRLNNNPKKLETTRQAETFESRISKIYQKRKGGK
ncbi:putative phage related protein, partial [Lactococcus cremoris subsp. cremoris GE214]